MRLIKINDIILNMDNIAVIKAEDRSEDYGGGVRVYAFTTHEKICLGVCDSREDYQKLFNGVYKDFGDSFASEIVYTEDEELWT